MVFDIFLKLSGPKVNKISYQPSGQQLTLNVVVVHGLLSFKWKGWKKTNNKKLKIIYCKFKVAHNEINTAENQESLGVLLLVLSSSNVLAL